MRAFVKRAVNCLKVRGVKGSIQRAAEGPQKRDILGFWNFIVNTDTIPFSYEDYQKNKEKKKTLNWVIPEMGKGSGGHINIFRFISYLEQNGFHNRLYIDRPVNLYSKQAMTEFVRENFKILDSNVDLYHNTEDMEYADAIVATSWQTAYFVRRFDNCISKFYFIQDYEPYFYPLGSEYEFAENTYRFGFRGLTAGTWLQNICIEQFGMKADSFSFSYDKDLYFPKEKTNSTTRVFFYARPVTPRRDFELGLLALEELCKRVPEVEVVFAGWDINEYVIPFRHQSLGILDISELSDLYSSCDLCFVISNTNLSLLPLEVMGSGSVAVCSKGPNSEWLVNSQNSVLVDYDPLQMALTMEWYLKHPEELANIRKKGIDFALKTSWEKEEEIVRKAILKGISEDEKCIGNRW